MPGGRKPGYRHTEETKQRMSAAQRAYRARVREAMKALAQLEAQAADDKAEREATWD